MWGYALDCYWICTYVSLLWVSGPLDSQTPSVSCCDILGSRGRFVCVCQPVCVCACVCVCIHALISVKGYCWRKEIWTKKGSSIIGFSIARRHNDTAIDRGMGSRERRTNGEAEGCFSQPPIGWMREAVGLQVAKGTSEHICHPSASWRKERVMEEDMWP